MGSTAIFIEAVKSGDAKTVKSLLEAEMDLARAKDQNGLSAVLLAVYYGHDGLVNVLVDTGIDLDIFEAAALGKMTRIVQLLNQQPDLVNSCAADGFRPLGLAAYFGHQTAVKTLLARGANVNQPSDNDLKIYPINSAVAHHHLAVTEILLDAGADINACEQGGYTSLHEAAANGHMDMVRLLLAHGADATLLSKNGKTPLDFALEKGPQEIIELLRKATRLHGT